MCIYVNNNFDNLLIHNLRAHTFIAANLGVALVTRKTGTNWAVVDNFALSVFATVTWSDATCVETSSVTWTLTVCTAPNTQGCLHCIIKDEKY